MKKEESAFEQFANPVISEEEDEEDEHGASSSFTQSPQDGSKFLSPDAGLPHDKPNTDLTKPMSNQSQPKSGAFKSDDDFQQIRANRGASETPHGGILAGAALALDGNIEPDSSTRSAAAKDQNQGTQSYHTLAPGNDGGKVS